MDNLISKLESLNFTKTESKVYLSLLKHGEMSGYQIGKAIGLSRSSIYSALDSLYKKGAITLLEGDSKIYAPINPKILIESIKSNFNSSANELMDELKTLQKPSTNEGYMNVKSMSNIILKLNEMIDSAKCEIYMNTDFDVSYFESNLKKAVSRGVRVILFSFSKLDFKDVNLEFYTHGVKIGKCGSNTRLMLVIDFKESLIASKETEEYLGTFSSNKLLVKITSEHIHHDIYLMKLKKKYGEELFDKNILLNTLMEEGNSFDN